MTIQLPSRYEDLHQAYKGRLVPNPTLIDMINKAHKAMKISGGIRFLPIYGESGSGKSSASRELSTHMPDVICLMLSRTEIENLDELQTYVKHQHELHNDKLLVFIIDQFEENVQGSEKIPTQFVEKLSLLDRGDLRSIPAIFIWLTTNKDFRKLLVDATSRNKRILLSDKFNITGPDKNNWPQIIEETFSFHNSDEHLSDYQIIRNDLIELAKESSTLGECIESVGVNLADNLDSLQNISEYQVILLWPVADSLRSQRILQFSRPKEGYKLNWDAWYTELNDDDRRTLPLSEFNRTRLYFDFRVIPIRAADLHRLCLKLDDDSFSLGPTYLARFQKTHFYHVISGNWKNYEFNPVRERESKRSTEARDWYETITTQPTLIGKRIAKILCACGLKSEPEKTISTTYSTVRADVYVELETDIKPKKIIELKVYSSENTMPSSIKDQIKVTLRRHAQLANFLPRQ